MTACGYKAAWSRDSAYFPLIAVTGYRSHAVRRVELIGYFVHFGHSLAYFTVITKAYKVIISHAVQL